MKNLQFSRATCMLATFGMIMLIIVSCKKQDDWLNIKTNKNDVTPKTLQDFQAVLDNSAVMNNQGAIMGLVSSDNVFIPDANLDAESVSSRNAYLWAKDIYEGGLDDDWFGCYQTVEYANIVLDGLNKLKPQDGGINYQSIKGAALFYRAFAFYQLCQLYAKPFIKATAGSDLGIPLRLSSDVNIKSTRSTVQQSYNQIISDLKNAVGLLPVTPLYKTRPCSVAANALLAKVYFSMSDYDSAFIYADQSLKTYGTLLDYNTLKVTNSNPFPSFAVGHPEIVYYAMTSGVRAVYSASSTTGRVSPELFNAYLPADLRKSAFFVADGSTGLYKFKGSYSARPYNFCGIATDELYLLRAECLARSGNVTGALSDLNALLITRYSTGSYSPYSTSDTASLISIIIKERRKEMPFTGNLRWEDLRRINQDNRFAVTIQRTYHGKFFYLLPNDNRYTFPIPSDEINLSGLQQNQR